MNIKPLPGWVLVEPEKEEAVTASGIKLPDSSQDVPMKGKILATGGFTLKYWDRDDEGRSELHIDDRQKPPVKVGQVALYKKYSGQNIKSEGKELKLVEFKDLLAVIE